MSEVLIQHAAVLNKRHGGGWLPMVWVNGERRGSTWTARGYDKDAAEVAAKDEAHAEASRFVGDWRVTVSQRECDHKRHTHESPIGLCDRCAT